MKFSLLSNFLIVLYSVFLSKNLYVYASQSSSGNYDLNDDLQDLSIQESISHKKHLPWTHTSGDKQTIYITDEVSISIPSKHHKKRLLTVINNDLKNFFADLNHDFYFGGYGGKANHLFVSLRLGFTKNRAREVSWENFVLCWDVSLKKFSYHAFNSVPETSCYADFYNVASLDWINQSPKNKQGKKVKFVSHNHQDVEGVVPGNCTHSEPGALGLILKNPDLIKHAIEQLDTDARIKVMQVNLHSFLDFCEHCNAMVQKFQENYPRHLFQHLKKHLPQQHYLNSKLTQNGSPFLFIMSGMNNRFYRYNEYHCADERQNFAGYFLQRYQPFPGKFKWNKHENSSIHLLTFVNEPIGHSGDLEYLPDNLQVMIPLKTSALYWELKAHTLYNDLKDFLTLINPKLIMLDLSGARLGIREDEDDGDCYTLSQGDEVINVLQALQPCHDLIHLDLSGNSLGQTEVISQLPNLFMPFSSLSFLSLSGTLPHNEYKLELFSETLKNLSTLEHLDLSNNGLNNDMFNSLQKSLDALKRLRILNLSQNRLSRTYDFDEDYKGSVEEDTHAALSWICDYIINTPSIRTVDVTFNRFDEIDFSWGNFLDEMDIDKLQLKKIRSKILIEQDAGDEISESSEEFSNSEDESDEDD